MTGLLRQLAPLLRFAAAWLETKAAALKQQQKGPQ